MVKDIKKINVCYEINQQRLSGVSYFWKKLSRRLLKKATYHTETENEMAVGEPGKMVSGQSASKDKNPELGKWLKHRKEASRWAHVEQRSLAAILFLLQVLSSVMQNSNPGCLLPLHRCLLPCDISKLF